MNRTLREEFPYYYAPGKQVFQVVLKLKDVQGGLGDALALLKPLVNFVSTHSYALGDGTALFTGFAEAVKPTSPDVLKVAVTRSPVVVAAEVTEGRGGLVVDSFHLGVKAGPGRVILMPTEALSSMFERITKVFGSGGEVILFGEGRDFGSAGGKSFLNLFGKETLLGAADYLVNNYAALGFGVGTLVPLGPGEVYRARVAECFECSVSRDGKRNCSFMRGVLEGFAATVLDMKVTSAEPRCRCRGDSDCEFVITKAG